MVKSAYIHIPFCNKKCKYCSFVSFTQQDKIQEYIKALIKEIDVVYKGEDLKTLYFGGGTPSVLPTKELKKILDKFRLKTDCEITLELNPDDATEEYLNEIFNIGINRLSVGSQTFNNDILKLIGRRHNAEQTIEAVKLAQKAGFTNISLDLIYGLPNQSLDNLKQDLNKITNLGIQHISTYGLKIEKESYWGKFPPNNIPDDDTQADMYILLNEYLDKKGYQRYEISNFALKNFESKHNLNYWENEEYYGFGIAAHGYIDKIRYSNNTSLDEYLKDPLTRKLEHLQSYSESLEEEIFLGFRKETGINITKIKEKFKIDFESKYMNILEKYSPKYIIKTNTGYKLTLEGVMLSNIILSEFLSDCGD